MARARWFWPTFGFFFSSVTSTGSFWPFSFTFVTSIPIGTSIFFSTPFFISVFISIYFPISLFRVPMISVTLTFSVDSISFGSWWFSISSSILPIPELKRIWLELKTNKTHGFLITNLIVTAHCDILKLYLSVLDLGDGLLDRLRFLELSYSAVRISEDLGLDSYLGSYLGSIRGSGGILWSE